MATSEEMRDGDPAQAKKRAPRGKGHLTQPEQPRAPVILNEETKRSFVEVQSRLDKLAKRHQVIAWIILALTLACVVAAILLIKFAGTLLGSDLQTARLNEPLVQDIEKQRGATEAKLEAKRKRTGAMKQEFDEIFGVGHLWYPSLVQAGFASRLTWVDLKGSTGLAVGLNQFLFTNDSGKIWEVPGVNDEPGESFEAAGAGFVIGVDTQTLGWVAGRRGKIARSKPGLEIWNVVPLKRSDGTAIRDDVYSLFFIDEKMGWAVGGGGLLAKTSDGGEKWSIADLPEVKSELYQVRFFKDKTGVAIGGGLTLLFSTDGGQTWVNQSASIAALLSNKNVQEMNLNVVSFDESRNYSDLKRIVVAGTDGLLFYSEPDGPAGTGAPKWKLARVINLDDSSATGVKTIRWLDRFANTPSMIAVGDNGTMLISRDRGETWRVQPAADRPTLLYAQSTAPDRASIAGLDGYLAQLELGASDAPAKLIRERTSRKDVAFYQLSPRDQREQVAIGDGVFRRIPLNPSLQLLKNLDPERFREVAINPASEQSYFENLPRGEEYDKLRDMIAELKLVNGDTAEATKELAEIDKRKYDAHSTNPVTTSDFMLWVTGARAFVVVIAFFMIRFLVSLYRYHNSQVARLETQATAWRALAIVPGTPTELRDWFGSASPAEDQGIGTLNEILNAAKDLIGARGKGQP